MELQRSFSDYYDADDPTIKTENETISGSNGNYYINHAIFSFHYQKTAIYLNSNSKAFLETCTFYNNSSTGYGGSFCIKESDCALVHLCLSLSSTSNYGCAYRIESKYGSNKKNYAFECSVSECYGKSHSLYHQWGDIQVSNMNTSYHKITSFAGYVLERPTGTGIMNFTTASNSSSTKYAVIYNYGNFKITKCNYLNNEFRASNWAIIFCSTSIRYSNCSFIGNKGNYLFYKKPIIDNCYFDENNFTQTVNDDPVTFKSIQPFDFHISHYSTEKCSATYFYNKKHSFNEEFMQLKKMRYIYRRR